MGSNYPAGMVGSSPLSSSKAVSSGSSSDCLNGLKFGQKIYFEDVGLGVPGKSSSGSSNSSAAGGSGCQGSPATPTKKGRGLVQSGQPPRCQVEGCNIDLSDAKAYYSRHKVCGMHSKSPVVIVGGIEQRFCQQCSRFHKLAEFDQGKRSCRRRLAGHNERRRKPPHGSLLSSRLGRLSSSVFATGSRGGSILLDFSAYSKLPGEDSWLGTATSDQAPVNHSCSSGKYLQGAWPGGNSKDPSTQMVPAGSSSRAGYSSPVVPLGECFTGASESSCALSLLSNQQWVSRNQASGIGLGNLMNAGGAPMAQSTVPSDGVATVNSYPCSNGNGSWAGFKASEAASNSLHDIRPDLGLNQISQPLGSDFVCDLEMAHHGGSGHYLEVEHSRAYNSSAHEHVHWSL